MNRHAYSLPISIQYPFVWTYSKYIWNLALSMSLYQLSKHNRVFYCAKYRIKHILYNLFTFQFDSLLKDGHCLNSDHIDFKPSIQISLGPFPVLMSRFFSKHSKVTYIAIILSKQDWFDRLLPIPISKSEIFPIVSCNYYQWIRKIDKIYNSISLIYNVQ